MFAIDLGLLTIAFAGDAIKGYARNISGALSDADVVSSDTKECRSTYC